MPESVNTSALLELHSQAAQPLEDLRMLRVLIARHGKDATLGQAQDASAQIIADLSEQYTSMKARGEAL